MGSYEEVLGKEFIDVPGLKRLVMNCPIPNEHRNDVWQLTLGILPPTPKDWSEKTQQLHKSYWKHTKDCFDIDQDHNNHLKLTKRKMKATFHQIQLDVNRTSAPSCPDLFLLPCVKGMMERVSFVWSYRRPKYGYFQGFCDLCIPFFLSLLRSSFSISYTDLEHFDPTKKRTRKEKERKVEREEEGEEGDMKEKGKEDDNGEEEVEWDEEEREGWEEKMREIEGKIFWLILRLLDSVPDYFEEKHMVKGHSANQLGDLVEVLDPGLVDHMNNLGLQFAYFAFRWYICMLQREIPDELQFRLWDIYTVVLPTSPRFLTHICCCYLGSLRGKIMDADSFEKCFTAILRPQSDEWWGGGKLEGLVEEAWGVGERERRVVMGLGVLVRGLVALWVVVLMYLRVVGGMVYMYGRLKEGGKGKGKEEGKELE